MANFSYVIAGSGGAKSGTESGDRAPGKGVPRRGDPGGGDRPGRL